MSKPEIETFQNDFELDQLVAIFNRLHPARVLEVGAWHGGTLWYWLQRADSVVVVDDGMRRSLDWGQWARDAESKLTLMQGSSQDQKMVDVVREFGPYDFIFIDGDHTYSSVRADWDNYSPMISTGGIIALHDILPRPGYGVSRLWGELKEIEGIRWMEICHNEVLPGNEGRCGIGIVFA